MPPLPEDTQPKSAPEPATPSVPTAAPPASATAPTGPNDEEPTEACDACDDDDCAACIAPDGRHRRRHGRALERTSVAGVRASYLRVRGTDHPGNAFSVAFAGGSEQYGGHAPFTAHVGSFFALGGGGAGFEGALGLALSGGVRAPIGDHHGPFVRIGAAGEMQGNDLFYFSRIELPLGEVGWQYRDGATLLELGARGAPVLTGRYNTGDATVRKLGGAFEWGGYAAAHAWFGRLDVQATRIEARGPLDTPVDLVRGTGCIYPWWRSAAMCFDLAYYDGDSTYDVLGPPPATLRVGAHSVYGGFLVGFGPW